MRPSSTWRRSRQLHKGQGGETFGFLVAAALFGVWFVVGLGTIIQILLQTTFGRIAEERLDVVAFYVQIVFPLLMWIVIWFVAILEFLHYIDLRIEKEGWDVDLAFRAERARMQTGSPFLAILFVVAITAASCLPAPATQSQTPTIQTPIPNTNLQHQHDSAVDQAKRSLRSGVIWRTNPWYSASRDDFAAIPFPPDRTTRTSSTPTRSHGGGLSWNVIRPFVYGLAFILFALLLLGLYFLVRAALEKWFGADFLSAEARREAAEKQRRIETLPVEAQADYNDLLAATLRAVQNGDWRAALILYFSYMLVELDRAECIRLHRGKTNHEYAWELNARADLRYYYCEAMYLFEKVYFGDYPIDESIFETIWKDRETFRNLLPRRP